MESLSPRPAPSARPDHRHLLVHHSSLVKTPGGARPATGGPFHALCSDPNPGHRRARAAARRFRCWRTARPGRVPRTHVRGRTRPRTGWAVRGLVRRPEGRAQALVALAALPAFAGWVASASSASADDGVASVRVRVRTEGGVELDVRRVEGGAPVRGRGLVGLGHLGVLDVQLVRQVHLRRRTRGVLLVRADELGEVDRRCRPCRSPRPGAGRARAPSSGRPRRPSPAPDPARRPS